MPRSAVSKRIGPAGTVRADAAFDVVAGKDSLGDVRQAWLEAFRAVRAETERRAALLSPEDQVVQSMPDASPTSGIARM